MEKIIVGSVESGDLMITISKTQNKQNNIKINSKFLSQFGEEIKTIVLNELIEQNAIGFDIDVNDQGSIPAVIRARIKLALERIENAKS